MPRSVLRFFAEYVVGRFRSVFLLLWAVQKKKRPKINNSSVFRFFGFFGPPKNRLEQNIFGREKTTKPNEETEFRF